MKILLLKNVKMPTFVGILTFMSGKNSILGLSEPKKAECSWYFYTYEHLKFHAPLSWAWIKFYNLGAWLHYHISEVSAEVTTLKKEKAGLQDEIKDIRIETERKLKRQAEQNRETQNAEEKLHQVQHIICAACEKGLLSMQTTLYTV